jgi:YD repeat-containing protein
VTRIERDGNGLPIKITNAAGSVTRIERDARGNVLLVIDALGGTTQWRYDARGLPIERVSAMGARTAFAYDAHANLERTTLPNGGVFQWTWDALGRLGFSTQEVIFTAPPHKPRSRTSSWPPRLGVAVLAHQAREPPLRHSLM